MKVVNAGDILEVKTGKYDANHAKENGSYHFFTCALEPLRTDTFSFNDEVIILPGNGANVGEVLYYCGKLEAYQRTYVLHNIKACPKYLYYYFKKYWIRQITKRQVGSATNYIKMDDVVSFQIPLPQLPQQKKIAAILDAADAYRQLTKALITKYDELTQSLFLDMFGDPVKNEKGWEVKKLGHITNMKAGKFIAASEIYSENSSNLQPCFGGNGLRGYVKSHTHEGEFVLIGRQGALCGNVKITSGKFHATEHAIVCSPEVQYSSLWLYYLLKLMNLNRFSTGAAQPGLNVGTLVDLEVFFVPLNLQNQFAERVQAIESQKAQAQASLEKAEELFNSLLQRAFKGEL
jgi:type I restriction enzyme S subunit